LLLGIHKKTTELSLLGPSTKSAYSLRNLDEMGLMSRTQAYLENREGRLVFRKIGRKTIVLHEDLIDWLHNLPRKDAISEPHRQRALRNWAHRKQQSEIWK
jgi:hypothetical protein